MPLLFYRPGFQSGVMKIKDRKNQLDKDGKKVKDEDGELVYDEIVWKLFPNDVSRPVTQREVAKVVADDYVFGENESRYEMVDVPAGQKKPFFFHDEKYVLEKHKQFFTKYKMEDEL